MYIHVYTCIYTCTRVYTRVLYTVYMCIYMCTRVYTCVHVYIHVYTCRVHGVCAGVVPGGGCGAVACLSPDVVIVIDVIIVSASEETVGAGCSSWISSEPCSSETALPQHCGTATHHWCYCEAARTRHCWPWPSDARRSSHQHRQWTTHRDASQCHAASDLQPATAGKSRHQCWRPADCWKSPAGHSRRACSTYILVTVDATAPATPAVFGRYREFPTGKPRRRRAAIRRAQHEGGTGCRGRWARRRGAVGVAV